MSLLGVTPGDRDPACTCGAAPGQLHQITCMAVARGQPHAMVDDDGDLLYPDSLADARYMARHHGARPVHPEAFAALFGDLESPAVEP